MFSCTGHKHAVTGYGTYKTKYVYIINQHIQISNFASFRSKKNLQISNGTVLSFLGDSRIYKLTVSQWASAAVVMYSSYYTDIFYNALMFQVNKIITFIISPFARKSGTYIYSHFQVIKFRKVRFYAHKLRQPCGTPVFLQRSTYNSCIKPETSKLISIVQATLLQRWLKISAVRPQRTAQRWPRQQNSEGCSFLLLFCFQFFFVVFYVMYYYYQFFLMCHSQ